jgi:hypothetical protein
MYVYDFLHLPSPVMLNSSSWKIDANRRFLEDYRQTVLKQTERKNGMRQKRKSGILKPVGWVIGLAAGCGLLVTGLWQAGIIEVNEPSWMPAWLSKDTPSADQKSPPASTKEAAPTPAKDGKTQDAKPEEGKSTPAPAAGAGGNAAGGQLLVQAQGTSSAGEGAKAWLDALTAVSLKPNEMFSLEEWVKNTAAQRKLEIKGEDISQAAGLLYEAALRAGLTVGERHIHQELPAYAAAGFDVEYTENGKNLTLLNSFSFPLQAGVSYTGDVPIVYLKGQPDDKWAAVNLEVMKEAFDPEKVELVDFGLGLGAGEAKRQEGKPGSLVRVLAKKADNAASELLAKDFYAPLPVVFARGPTSEEAGKVVP